MPDVDHDAYAAQAFDAALFFLLSANLEAVALKRRNPRPRIAEYGGQGLAPALLEHLPPECYRAIPDDGATGEDGASAYDLGLFRYAPGVPHLDPAPAYRALLAHLAPFGRLFCVFPGEFAETRGGYVGARTLVERATAAGFEGACPCPLGLPGDASFLASCCDAGVEVARAGKMLSERALAACDASPTAAFDLGCRYRLVVGFKNGPRLVTPPERPSRLILPN